MSQADFWYIRFPDGRILRAASTTVLRQELNAGHIPLGSKVRRSSTEEWVSLEWSEEFAELVEELAARAPPSPSEPAQPSKRRNAESPMEPASRRSSHVASDNSVSVGSRLDSSRLPLVGVRSYLDELLTALDSTLVAKKLLLGACAGLLLGALFALERAEWFEPNSPWRALAWLMFAVGIVLFDGLGALLTRMTYLELARLRPARWREGLEGMGRLTVWIVVSQLIVRGSAWGLIVLLRWLPFWLGPSADESWSMGQQILGGTTLCLGMILEALIWPSFFFWWQLPPLLVVEDCTVWRGLRQWLILLRQHWSRVLLYQTMAVGLGVLIAVPFLLPIAPLLLPSFYPPEGLQNVVRSTSALLLGLACAPMLTYWITANVFIYLNLRYGASNRR